MDYEALGNSALFWGSVWVGVGAIIVSAGWFFLGFHKQTSEWLAKRRRLRAATPRRTVIVLLAAILGGSILIVWGGTLTTKGWNLLDNHETKKALIAAVALEWVHNEMYMSLKPLSFDPNDKTIGQEHYGFPQFKTAAVNGVLTSSLFDPSNPHDFGFLSSIVDYERCARHCNIMFLRLDEKVGTRSATAEVRKAVYDSVNIDWSVYADFKKLHKNLHDVFVAEHRQELTNAQILWERYKAVRKERGYSLPNGASP